MVQVNSFEEEGGACSSANMTTVICWQIDQAKLEDDGVYQCVITNEYGRVKSDCVEVSIATSVWDEFTPAPCM